MAWRDGGASHARAGVGVCAGIASGCGGLVTVTVVVMQGTPGREEWVFGVPEQLRRGKQAPFRALCAKVYVMRVVCVGAYGMVHVRRGAIHIWPGLNGSVCIIGVGVGVPIRMGSGGTEPRDAGRTVSGSGVALRKALLMHQWYGNNAAGKGGGCTVHVVQVVPSPIEPRWSDCPPALRASEFSSWLFWFLHSCCEETQAMGFRRRPVRLCVLGRGKERDVWMIGARDGIVSGWVGFRYLAWMWRRVCIDLAKGVDNAFRIPSNAARRRNVPRR
jgi:hypothetical protein